MFGRFVLGLTLAITDVAGPPVPPTRFSSLPIRGANTPTDGRDGSDLVINCNMAQAFEVPMGAGSGRAMFSHGSHRTTPDTFQIAAPGRPDPSAGSIAGIWV